MSQHFGGGCHFEVREEQHQAFSLPTFSPFHQGQEGAFRQFQAFPGRECRYPLPTLEIDLGGGLPAPYACDNHYNWNNNDNNPVTYGADNSNYPYNQNGNPNNPSNQNCDGYNFIANQPAQPGDYIAPPNIAYDAYGNPINAPAQQLPDVPQTAPGSDKNAGQGATPGSDQIAGQVPAAGSVQTGAADNTDYAGMAEKVANHVPLSNTDAPGFLPAPKPNDGFMKPSSDESAATDTSHYADWAEYVAAHVPLGTTDTPGFLAAPESTAATAQK